MLRVVGKAPLPGSVKVVLNGLQVIWLLVILALMIRRKKWDAPAVFAGAVAMIGWMLVFSPIYWEHYAVYLCPFWGWLVFEGGRSRSHAVRAVIGIALLWMPLAVVPGVRLPEPIGSHLLWGTILISELAMERLANQRILDIEPVAAT